MEYKRVRATHGEVGCPRAIKEGVKPDPCHMERGRASMNITVNTLGFVYNVNFKRVNTIKIILSIK